MKVRVSQIDLPAGYSPEQLKKAVSKKLRCPPSVLSNVIAVRRSIDARGKEPRMIVQADAEMSGSLRNGLKNVEKARPIERAPSVVVDDYCGERPLVVGAGPAGLLAAYALAKAGLKPLMIERGEAAAPRAKSVDTFWKDGSLDEESNVLYGEGGAGLFSDGKLTSRSKDRGRVRRFLEIMIEGGASPDILVDSEPHIGSDILEELVPRLRNQIIEMGGEVRFGARLDNLHIENGAVRGAVINGEEFRTDRCILATGHSARDAYTMLADLGVPLEAKGFAVGVRLEIPQHRIDGAQWGGSYPNLGSASFRLTRREEQNARSCYTFCMCPGGMVISCASSKGLMTTNGMSLSKRDEFSGNAAFLVPVMPSDFPQMERPELAGIEFQRKMEEAAFIAGGGNYALPAQRLVDFLEGSAASALPDVRSCERATPFEVRSLLPEFVSHTLQASVPRMLRGMRGVQIDEALIYASETRSSSPVRVIRGDDCQSTGVRGLYPCGEGAGYAGGIVSSGVDGLRVAEAILEHVAS